MHFPHVEEYVEGSTAANVDWKADGWDFMVQLWSSNCFWLLWNRSRKPSVSRICGGNVNSPYKQGVRTSSLPTIHPERWCVCCTSTTLRRYHQVVCPELVWKPYLHVEIHELPCRRDTSNQTIVNSARRSLGHIRSRHGLKMDCRSLSPYRIAQLSGLTAFRWWVTSASARVYFVDSSNSNERGSALPGAEIGVKYCQIGAAE